MTESDRKQKFADFKKSAREQIESEQSESDYVVFTESDYAMTLHKFINGIEVSILTIHIDSDGRFVFDEI